MAMQFRPKPEIARPPVLPELRPIVATTDQMAEHWKREIKKSSKE